MYVVIILCLNYFLQKESNWTPFRLFSRRSNQLADYPSNGGVRSVSFNFSLSIWVKMGQDKDGRKRTLQLLKSLTCLWSYVKAMRFFVSLCLASFGCFWRFLEQFVQWCR